MLQRWASLSRRAKIIISVVVVFFGLAAIGSAGAEKPNTADASATPLAVVSVASSATATLEPTAEPTFAATTEPAPEPTPEPTAEPTPEPTEEPTPEPAPAEAFKVITLEGRGSKVPKFTIPEGVPAIAKITYTGSSNFAVWSLDGDGGEDLLVNEIGRYKGTVLFDEGGHSVAFKVEASGAWKIVVAPITRAADWDISAGFKSSGDNVVRLSASIDGFYTSTIKHSGDSNFAVFAYGVDGRDLLVNEIGSYAGEILWPDGTLLLEVTADGTWSISTPQ